ncbi:GNAT family N-acetyltransferase [Streptomyces roseifaciens]
MTKLPGSDVWVDFNALAGNLMDRHGLILWLAHEPMLKTVVIVNIAVPKSRRGRGIGRLVIQKFCDEADKHDYRLAGSPTGEYGTDVERFRAFCTKQGFQPNTWDENGNRTPHPEIAYTMVRPAKEER